MTWLTRTALVALSIATLADGQTETLRFDAASVKLAPDRSDVRPDPTGASGGPGTSDPGRIAFTNLPLTGILPRAFGVQHYQIVGPESLHTVRYDIVAAVPQGTTREQLNIMLQNFLKERFNLATHHEVRSVLGYELGVARPTPKLRLVTVVSESQSEGATPNQPAAKAGSANRPGIFVNMRTVGEDPGVYLTVKEQTLAAVANFLTRQLSAPVSDVTGLTGKYDFSLAYLPPAGAPTSLPSSLPALAEALNAEVGLKLASRRIPLDMLVVDPVNKVPTEN